MAPHAITPDSSPSYSPQQSSFDSGEQHGPFMQSEPIAIIGMGCRLPGDSSSPSKLWNLLLEGRHGRRPIDQSRFNVDGFYHPDGDRPGSMSTEEAYLVNEDIREFQNNFFGINNLEATYMDPQQRKLLEVTYECFESAGLPLSKVSGANIGCYVGNFTTDFQTMQAKDSEYLHRYSATGMGTTILANRISHAFNMTGPSFVLDTACSSSLYCLHVACTAIDAGECDTAVVAGANLIQSPEQHLGTLKAGVLSKTSTCHTFDTSADGYGRADGVGVLLVKRLDQALKDGDPIRSIVRGTAVNSNGKTNGITLPSADGQEAVIRKAYARSGLNPRDTQYCECHGTGTAVGDPIEVDALSRVMGKSERPNPTLIGSVKTNLGHSEAASAISSIMKVSMAMEHKVIPETIGVKNVNPKIKLDEWNVEIVSKQTAWPKCETKRAGINSFGYGGANAHAILEGVPASIANVQHPNPPNTSTREHYLLPFSAYNKASMLGWVNDLGSSEIIGQTNVSDLAYTLAEHRSRFSTRGFIVADQRKLPVDLSGDHVIAGEGTGQQTLPYAFVFTGQGAQWAGMGRELMAEFPIFKASIQSLDAVLKSVPHPPAWTLESAILEPVETSQINKASHSQPVCTAIQVALVELYRSWNVNPAAVIGHSSGEIAAAFAAGHMDAGEAIVSAYYRGFVVAKSQLNGTMMAAGLSPEAANEVIADLKLQSSIRVACVNSPESVTISGDSEGIDVLFTDLQNKGTFARKLKTDGRAYHSHHMAAIGDEYEALLTEALRQLPNRPPTKFTGTKFVSSVTNEEVVSNQTRTAAYWRSNLENPVRFAGAVKALVESQKYFLIELGPHGALELPIKQTTATLENTSLPYASALTRGKHSVVTALGVVGKLFNAGYDVAFDLVNLVPEAAAGNGGYTTPKVLVNLPNYHWTYDQDLWNESRASTEYRNRKYRRHDLLGSAILGGSKLTMTWRNVLKSNDLPWLPGHKLSKTTVVPGAAYLAMAVEALCQYTGTSADSVSSINLRDTTIAAALTLEDEAASGVEIFTEMRPRSISSASTSGKWYEFSISSFASEGAIVHARGEIALDARTSIDRQVILEPGKLQPNAPRVWYERFANVGLNFDGPFRSMKEINVPRRRDETIASAKTNLVPETDSNYLESDYMVHPATIDALLQCSLVATSCGVVNDLHAKVPVRIGHMSIRPPPKDAEATWRIDAKSEKTGFGSVDIMSELYDEQTQDTIVQFREVRCLAYQGSEQQTDDEDRHPMLRVVWKPDVTRATSANLNNYLPSGTNLAALAGSLAHKDAGLSYVDLSMNDTTLSMSVAEQLHVGSGYARCAKYARKLVGEDEKIQLEQYSTVEAVKKHEGTANTDETFDVVIATAATDMQDPFVAQASYVLGSLEAASIKKLIEVGFEVAETKTSPTSSESLVFAQRPSQKTKDAMMKSSLVLATREERLTEWQTELKETLSQTFATDVVVLPLSKLSVAALPAKSTVVCLFEAAEPLLAGSTDSEYHAVKVLTDNAANLLWVTNGDLLNGAQPDMGLVNGLSRALMLEQPSLTFSTLDLERGNTDHKHTTNNIITVLTQLLSEAKPDFEYVQKGGVLHVSRFVEEPEINATFTRRQRAGLVPTRVADIGAAQLSVESVGQLDTLHFKPSTLESLPADHVEMSVTAAGINAKDYYTLTGKVETKDAACNSDAVGVITNVGPSVKNLQRGDRVVSMAPSQFATVKQLPEWACVKLEDREAATDVAALPLVFSTALYALKNRANLRQGESVLIHSAAGGLGLAAIQIAQILRAEIYATAGSESKREYLADEFGLNPSHIFNSHDSSFLPAIMSATNGTGVDVVLNSLSGDLLHDSWRACAPFGRFIELGKKDIADAGVLEMSKFKQSATFSAFDLGQLYESSSPSHHRTWNELLQETMNLYRAGHIRNAQVAHFDASEVAAAFQEFGVINRMGKIVVSLEDPTAMVQYLPPKHSSVFSADKSYLMIGCLGGLGRSMSKWMMSRGARKFVFLGRSGTDRTPARQLVEDLEDQGAQVTVVRGDVVRYADVEKAVAAIKGPIGGVIQAAMGLNESLFTTMPNEYWHTGIDPKVIGTWNLHNAIKGKDAELDFFLMTSSISGSVGTATESNYCAGNFFLDTFARFRHAQGLPARSIGLGMISEVGYLHENPEIEAILLRKGIQAISEGEMLQIVDLALSSDAQHACAEDANAASHVLTGLEPFGLKNLRKKGFEGESPVLHDPRATVLLSALGASGGAGGSSASGLPTEIAEAMEAGAPLNEAVQGVIARKFCNFILLPLEKLDPSQALSDFGMDSMLAAEFRSWFYQLFKVDIPFLTLLAKTTNVHSLAQNVAEELSTA
ncbi:MAG: hypothetical protein Q9159_001542 [Coniocarpon cinnabarinum]